MYRLKGFLHAPEYRLSRNGKITGFSLAEVLIAMAVISILIAGAFPSLASYSHQVRFARIFQGIEERFYDSNARVLSGLQSEPLRFQVGEEELLKSISFQERTLSELYLTFDGPFSELHFKENLGSTPLDEVCAPTPKKCFVTLSYGLPESNFRKIVTINLQKYIEYD